MPPRLHFPSTFAAVLLLLTGCYSREDVKTEGGVSEQRVENDLTTMPRDNAKVAPDQGAPNVAVEETAASTAPLTQVNVFLEVSGSMEGFMPKPGADASNTRFQQQVAQFLSELNNSPAVGRKTYYRIKERPYRDSYQQLSGTVRGGIKEPASSTDIPTVLDTLASNYYAPNTVSVLISDFIYSPRNTGAIPYIKTDITDAISRAQRSDLAMSVYGFTSDFQGAFYPAIKTGAKKVANCCDTDIPYYFWVIGPQDAVRRFDAALLARQSAQQIHFGIKYPQPSASLLNKYQNKGSWYYGEKTASKRAAGATYYTVAVQEASPQNPVEFVLGLNLSTMPALYRDLAYLKQNLQLIGQDTDARIVNVAAATDQTRASSGPENQYTHFVKVRLTKMARASRSLQVVLKDARPAWVSQWTTQNDSNIDQVGPKTFAFASLIDGVATAIGNGQKSPAVFQIPLTLEPAK
ncbi:hypothetical protein [Hymenobacter roseosalivarius]|uniref:hypothetical protein n=1 Tax=Hymenobacter roseosalivarius TaxID=89967 RepID=UPI00117B954D|nr:hypothetical protein [Hymenobacter roseosalivarius]